MTLRLVLMMIAVLLFGQQMTAQTDHVFKMLKENGHFFVETTVKTLKESGVTLQAAYDRNGKVVAEMYLCDTQ